MAGKTINPTRMELTRLKGRLKTAVRGHKLLKDKRDEMMKQFLEIVRRNRALRRKVEEGLGRANGAFTVASAVMGPEMLRVSTMVIFRSALSSRTWLLVFAAVLIPILAYATQVLNFKLMPQSKDSKNAEPGTMESQMKSMNTVMPIMSAVFCFTLPVGIGIYWIAGAVVRSIQQVVINKHLDKEDVDTIIEKNKAKEAKKREKQGLPPQKITQEANRSVRRLDIDRKVDLEAGSLTGGNASYKPGSLAEKANMVRRYEETHKKK